MFTNRMIRRLVLAPAVALACAGIAACGSTKDNSGSGTAPAGKADVAAARAAIAPYIGKPSAFPVDRPLAKGLPPGKKLAFLQCVTPFCALLAQLHGMAAKLMGTQVEVVKATGSSDSIQTALSSIAAQRPAALLLPAVNLGALGGSLTKLTSEGIPVAGAGVMGGKPQGIDAPMNGPYTIGLGGRILADWAIVNGGTGGSVAFYGVPELDFSKVETDAFKVKTNGFAPTPSNLEDIKTGGLDAAIGLDAGVLAFSQMDAAVRLATGQPLTAAEKNGAVPIQLLTKKNLGSDVSHGWTGYPDFPARFAKLWAAAK